MCTDAGAQSQLSNQSRFYGSEYCVINEYTADELADASQRQVRESPGAKHPRKIVKVLSLENEIYNERSKLRHNNFQVLKNYTF